MSRISSKNQVTIPVDVLRAAGLGPGDDVRIVGVAPGRLLLTGTNDVIAELAGCVDADVYGPGYLEEVRRGWG